MAQQEVYGQIANYNISPGTRGDGQSSALEVTSTGDLKVTVTNASSIGGGTQYTDAGTPPAHPIGNAIEWNNAGTWATTGSAAPLPTTLYLGTTAISIGQQLAAASVPVILPSATISTLTPPSNTGYALDATLLTIDTDLKSNITLHAGTNVIGHVIADSGSTTAVTGNVTVVQPTGTSLHAVLDANSGVDIGKLTANQSVNVSQINAATPLMGNGITGTGSQRVTIASDNTAFSVNATLSAETTKVIGTVNQGTSPWVASATLQTQTDTVMVGGVNVKEINAVTPLMGNGATGTGSQRVTIASDNTPFPVKVDQTTPGTTNAVSIAQIGATTIVNGGTAGSQSVGGIVANNGTINSAVNPILVGGQAVSSENAAGTTAKLGQFVTDLVGKQIVLPYANPENFVSGRATATDTTSTSLLAAPASGLRNYITQITVWNASAVSTYIKIQDGSGGTELYDIPAPAGGGATLSLPTPLRQPTTATAIFFAANASANAVFVSASGYKGI